MFNQILFIMHELQKKLQNEMQLRNYSQRSINTYLACLSRLSDYFNQTLDTITTQQVKDYLHYRVTTHKASVSLVNQTISAYKLLHKDVLGNDYEKINLNRPRREKRLPVILSRDEVNSIIKATKNIKHRAILMVIYSGGLRISEVINLRINDIDSKRMQIRINHAKGHKDRQTILSHKTLKLLREYYSYYRPNYWLFEGWKGKKYSVSSIQKVFKRSCAKENIEKAVTVHSLRHSFATHLLEQGVSIQIIQRLLGHANAKTTCVYLHVQQYSIDKVLSPIDFKDNTL